MKINHKVLYLAFIITLTFLSGCNDELQNHKSNIGQGRTILMIIAPNNFRDEELFIPKREFEAHGFRVIVSSSQREAHSMCGKKVTVDLLLNDSLNLVDNISAVVFSGGSGVSVYYNNSIIRNLILKAYNENKTIGAICLAPIILSKAGILNGKKATVWDHSFINTLKQGGAIYTDKGVVVDSNIVTSNSPRHAKEFADTIIGLLQSEKR